MSFDQSKFLAIANKLLSTDKHFFSQSHSFPTREEIDFFLHSKVCLSTTTLNIINPDLACYRGTMIISTTPKDLRVHIFKNISLILEILYEHSGPLRENNVRAVNFFKQLLEQMLLEPNWYSIFTKDDKDDDVLFLTQTLNTFLGGPDPINELLWWNTPPGMTIYIDNFLAENLVQLQDDTGGGRFVSTIKFSDGPDEYAQYLWNQSYLLGRYVDPSICTLRKEIDESIEVSGFPVPSECMVSLGELLRQFERGRREYGEWKKISACFLVDLMNSLEILPSVVVEIIGAYVY